MLTAAVATPEKDKIFHASTMQKLIKAFIFHLWLCPAHLPPANKPLSFCFIKLQVHNENNIQSQGEHALQCGGHIFLGKSPSCKNT